MCCLIIQLLYLILLSLEQLLEDSGISVAPPERAFTELAGLPPVSAPSISGCIRRAVVPIVPKLPSQVIGSARSASVVIPILPKLPSQDITSESLSTNSSDADDDDDVDMDKTPRKKTSKRTRVPTPESDAPSTASQTSKVSRCSVSHSSASQSEADIPEPSVSGILSRSGSLIDPQGSSRMTGGFNRGRAVGNNFNMADTHNMDTDFSYATKPVRGKILLFTDGAKGAAPQMTIRQDVGNQLGPILHNLGRRYSPVRKSQGCIYVMEDNMWSLRGKFDEALTDPDPVEWDAAADGSLTLSIMSDLGMDKVNQFHTVSSYSSSTSAISGSVLQPASPAAVTWDKALGPNHIQLATILGISPGSTNRKKGDLQESYMKYLAVIKLMGDVKQRTSAGTWPENVPQPDLADMVEVFVAKSTWYEYHSKLFPKCSTNPLMLKWLKGEADASEAKEIWGEQSPSFRALKVLLGASDMGTNAASGSCERKTKDKGKGKEKEKEKDKKSHKKNL